MNLHVGAPNPINKEKFFNYLNSTLNANWITNFGDLNKTLENKIEEYLGVKHCVSVCNATIGLQLLFKALDLSGEVIIPSFTFIATAHSLKFLNIEPVFCDIDSHTHLIDPLKIESLITSKTSAILAVPLWGQPLNYNVLDNISKKHNLKLIFDSAHAFGSKHKNTHLGCFGSAEVFSFHATKVFSTCEGGAITTNNDELAKRLKVMRNFGFTGENQIDYVGTNAKLNEFNSAYGLVSLESLNHNIAHNKWIYEKYLEIFKNTNIKVLEYNPKHTNNHHYLVASAEPRIRDKLIAECRKQNIFLKKYFYPGIHNQKPYKLNNKGNNLHLPNTEYVSQRVLCFPTGSQMNEDKIKLLNSIFSKYF